MAFCPKCGATIFEDDSFCRGCGVKLREEKTKSVGEAELREYMMYGPRLIPTNILTASEVPLVETRPLLWIRLIGPILFTVLGIGISAFAYAYFDLGGGNEWILYICAGIFIFGLFWIILRLLRWRYTVYAATNKRVLEQSGIIGKDYVDCPLEKIQNVYLQISIIGRLFDFGTIRIATAGAGWVEMIWQDVKQPRITQRILNQIIDEFRRYPT